MDSALASAPYSSHVALVFSVRAGLLKAVIFVELISELHELFGGDTAKRNFDK